MNTTHTWNWGDLRRTNPISRFFGFDRGTPIDRYYIEAFLEKHKQDITGRTLEIGDDTYTRRFGENRTNKRDVLHIHEGNPAATIVGDLATANHISSDAFDCIVLTQTLQLISDLQPAVQTIHRILRPGGVLLATIPGISQITIDEWQTTWGRTFTCRALKFLLAPYFSDSNLTLRTYGNTLAAACFLQGMASHELSTAQRDLAEPDCEMLIAVRAVK